uniref:NADH-ubiquinone oxidoreductase chain 3 n=1 Tax=Aulacochilus grouvellei TaxID=2800504 RepID=A0A7T6YA17_9CUCU|nr:NADH dehydrogenase subunit 3 [Aulacochilus grouvellei]QQK56318.1 NADH dehydrogenase subunit 3 [Aulacochilus grouvellei]
MTVMILYSFYLTIFVIFIMMFMLNIVSKKSFSDRDKSSPFECGFDSKNSARLPFSLQFFLIAIIFLIFDVEITLLLPMVISLTFSSMMYFYMVISTFIMILLLGTYYEWTQGALDWMQ